MKYPLYIIAVMLLFSAIRIANAQNLIPNPSFEDLSFCPTDAGQVPLAEPWLMMLTPDLYAACTESPSYDVPENFTCNVQEPKDGQAYVGLWSYTSYEYIFTDLLEPLKAGKNYFARMYVVPNDDCNPFVAYTQMDAFAMAVRQPGNQNNLFIVAENTNGLITDTEHWTEITGCYQAQGGERTIQIGNIRGNTGTNIHVDSTLFPNQPYFVYMFVDDLLLEEYDPFPDTLYLCNEETIELDATFHEATYSWSTGDTGAILQITEAGSYAAIAEIGGCRLIDRVEVIAMDLPEEMPVDTSICKDGSVLLTTEMPGQYQWSTGSTNSEITVSQSGNYALTVTNDCGEFIFDKSVEEVACECRVFVPNGFSPNDDGINDRLDVFIDCDFDFTVQEFKVFDRWGGLVFSNPALTSPNWNGKINGRPATAGVYTWFLTYSLNRAGEMRQFTESGDVVLLR